MTASPAEVRDYSSVPQECLPYRETTSDQLGGLAAKEMSYTFVPETDPEDVVVAGPCPRCRGSMTYKWPLVVVRQLTAETSRELQITVWCECPLPHPGAGDKRGCGAYWNLLVERPS